MEEEEERRLTLMFGSIYSHSRLVCCRVVVPSKRKDSRLAALRHKQQLQQMLVEQTKQDSGIEDDHDLDPDNAIELMGPSHTTIIYVVPYIRKYNLFRAY